MKRLTHYLGKVVSKIKNLKLNMDKPNKISLFAVSFSQGFVSPDIPIATFYQGDKELHFILDSGSNDNVISHTFLKQLDYNMKESNPESDVLAGVGGVKPVKVCTLSFSTEETKYTADFLVSDSLDEAFQGIRKGHCITIHGMLGSKFLRQHNVVIDYTTLSAYSKA